MSLERADLSVCRAKLKKCRDATSVGIPPYNLFKHGIKPLRPCRCATAESRHISPQSPVSAAYPALFLRLPYVPGLGWFKNHQCAARCRLKHSPSERTGGCRMHEGVESWFGLGIAWKGNNRRTVTHRRVEEVTGCGHHSKFRVRVNLSGFKPKLISQQPLFDPGFVECSSRAGVNIGNDLLLMRPVVSETFSMASQPHHPRASGYAPQFLPVECQPCIQQLPPKTRS